MSLQWKDEFFWSVFFTVFFRLPVYKSISAIFWQSASYVDITELLKQFFIRFSPFFTTDTETDLHFGDTLQSVA